MYFFLFTLSDIFSDRFCDALDRFGGHFQTGQDLHLFTAVIEGSLLTDQGVHAAHTGRELGVLNVQFHVGRKLALMTVRAQIVGTPDLYRSHHRQHRFATLFPIMGTLATRASDDALLFCRRGCELQQFGQRGGAGMVHGRAHRHLHCFQIQTPGLAPTVEDDAQELIYFAHDFLADRFRRFFS